MDEYIVPKYIVYKCIWDTAVKIVHVTSVFQM